MHTTLMGMEMRRRSKGKTIVYQHDQQQKPESSCDNEELFLGKNTSSSPRLLSMGMGMGMGMGMRMMMKSNPQLLYAIRIALSAGMSGLVIGYHSGIVYSVLRYSHFEFRREAPTTWLRMDESGVKVMVTFGSCLAALMIGFTNVGQRFTIVLGVLCFLWAPILYIIPLMLLCPVLDHKRDLFGNFCQLPVDAACIHCRLYQICGFYLMGVAAGFFFMGVPLYIAEISPTSIRGALVTTFFLQIAAGQIIYFLIRCLTSIQIVGQLMLGVILTIVYLLLLRFPESPRELYKKGEINAAVEIMRKIHPPHEVDKELDSLRLSLESTEIAEEAGSTDHDDEKISCPPRALQWLFPVVGCFLAQILMGFNVVLYFTPTILVHLVGSGYDSDNLIFMHLLVISVLSAIGSVLCIAFVDRYGRRRLLLVSTLGIVACLGFCSYLFSGGGGDAMATAFTRRSTNTTNCECQARWCTSIREEERGLPTGLFGFSALVALGLYFIFYSLGIGTIPWIINSEIYPLRYRTIWGTMAPGIFCFLSPIIYAIYEDYLIEIYIAKTFLLSTVFASATCLFIYFCVPETKGYRLEEIENKLRLHAYGCSTTCTSCLKPKGSMSNKKSSD